MEKKAVVKNYIFLGIMLGAMIIGALVGWLAPSVAPVVKPLGTVFINMMFCVVVPLVFVSIAGSIANMKSMKRAGKIMGTTVATFVIAGSYGRAMAVYYPLCFIYIFTAFPLFAWFGGGKHGVKTMFKHITKPAVVSLGTCSSVATIPTNLEEAEDTGVSKDVAEMVVPLGATMHMDGSCFSCVLKIAFVWGVFGQDMSWGKLIPIVLVAVLSSVGMSGVPGGGYIGEYIICSIFFPNQMELAFPILVAIGNLVDPPATMINSAGDYVVTYIVSRFADGKDWLEKALAKKKETAVAEKAE